MNESELARKLADSDKDKQTAILEQRVLFEDLRLAEELKKLCYEAWLAHPETTRRIISAFQILQDISEKPETAAFALWSRGVGETLDGQMEAAVKLFNNAAIKFESLNLAVSAAETQVGKLYALAVLGLYDEAIECGLMARQTFLQNNEMLAVGKIEHNLGNIYQRRDQYEKAEDFLRMARTRFDHTTEFLRLIQSDNSLANALAHQHKFSEAELIYERALKTANLNNLEITRAEIESNLGHLLFFQGRFDRALKYFEGSRRLYEKLSMPHQTAIAEQEIADTYLELNLALEAAAIYERVTVIFEKLGMKAEKAATLANFARACVILGEASKAHKLLFESQQLYADEGNVVGEAQVKFAEAKLFHSEKNYLDALKKAAFAEDVLLRAKFFSRGLHARWLRGENMRLIGETKDAKRILQTAREESEKRFIPQNTLRCWTSLGQIEAAEGNFENAEDFFRKAVKLVEEMRAPLPAEDFRTAFLADKLTPYQELIKLYLSRKEHEKAFEFAENARSRVLMEMLEGDNQAENLNESRQDLKTLLRLEKLREELNWFYSKLNRLPFEANFDAVKLEKFQAQIIERENEILEINRKLNIFAKGSNFAGQETLNLEMLQKYLGETTVLIEFLMLDSRLSAFIVSDGQIFTVENFASEDLIFDKLESLRFHIDGMKSPAARRSAFQNQMIARTKKYLHELYQIIFAPLEKHLSGKKIVIVPHGLLHYVPFHALFDGTTYQIENFEIVYAPSAKVFLKCSEKQKRSFQKAVLLGVEDEITPNVRGEIESVAKIFPQAKILLDEHATFENLQMFSESADILHLACHGKFRPDSPLFSGLQLFQNWLNVRDAYRLRLDASLVVLSACETGINSIAIGDELLGLTRGFLSAGASSLILSLWQVDDDATARLMSLFYEKLNAAVPPSQSLRAAQLQILQTDPHPFYWSPFVMIGGL